MDPQEDRSTQHNPTNTHIFIIDLKRNDYYLCIIITLSRFVDNFASPVRLTETGASGGKQVNPHRDEKNVDCST